MNRDDRAAALAGEVIALAQSTLMVHLRFLDRALACLRPSSHDTLWFASDGLHLYYEPWYVLGEIQVGAERHQPRPASHLIALCIPPRFHW